MELKRCFKCKAVRPIDEFYVHKQMADRHLGKCKGCAKEDVTANRNKNIDKARAYDRARSKLPHRKKMLAENSRQNKKKNPIKYHARYLLNNALRDKRITKPMLCMRCGRQKRLIAHHHDYYQPLAVLWVCSPCHYKEHNK